MVMSTIASYMYEGVFLRLTLPIVENQLMKDIILSLDLLSDGGGPICSNVVC